MAITDFGNVANEMRAVPLLNRNMEHQPEHRIVLQPKQLEQFVPCSGSLCDFELTVINGNTVGLNWPLGIAAWFFHALYIPCIFPFRRASR